MAAADVQLLASGADDLLPTNTTIFASTVRWPRVYYLAIAATVLTCGGLFFAGVSNPASAAALVSTAFALGAVASLGLFLWRQRLYRAYAADLARGAWHQGLIVFPSGDVVVRYHRLVGNLDQTIESASVSRVEVERGCAWHLCRIRPFLRLYYVAIDGRGSVLSICQSDLVDRVDSVAEYINELKAKAMAF
jgi:hypothetical protein